MGLIFNLLIWTFLILPNIVFAESSRSKNKSLDKSLNFTYIFEDLDTLAAENCKTFLSKSGDNFPMKLKKDIDPTCNKNGELSIVTEIVDLGKFGEKNNTTKWGCRRIQIFNDDNGICGTDHMKEALSRIRDGKKKFVGAIKKEVVNCSHKKEVKKEAYEEKVSDASRFARTCASNAYSHKIAYKNLNKLYTCDTSEHIIMNEGSRDDEMRKSTTHAIERSDCNDRNKTVTLVERLALTRGDGILKNLWKIITETQTSCVRTRIFNFKKSSMTCASLRTSLGQSSSEAWPVQVSKYFALDNLKYVAVDSKSTNFLTEVETTYKCSDDLINQQFDKKNKSNLQGFRELADKCTNSKKPAIINKSRSLIEVPVEAPVIPRKKLKHSSRKI